MARTGLALLISVLTTLPLQATCHYFRIRAKSEHCKPLPPQAAPDRGDALLQDSPDGPSVQLVCDCEYTLRGAGPLSPECDLDHSDEPTFVTPVDDAKDPCRDSHRLCQELCPKEEDN